MPRPESTSAVSIRIHPLPQEVLSLDPAEFFIHDRRVGERRTGERRRTAENRRVLSVAD